MSGDVPGAHAGQVIPWPGQPRSAAPPLDAQAPAVERAEHRRSVWLRESRIIAAGYLVDGMLVGMFAAVGAVHWSAVLLCTLPGWITCAVAGILIARGHSRNWKDPAVSDAQAFAGMAICVAGIVLYPEISFLYVLSLATIFLGITYRMSRQCIHLSWGSTCAVIGLITLWDDPLQIPFDTRAEQLIAGACGAATLARAVIFSVVNRGRNTLLHEREQQVAEMLEQVERLADFDELTSLPNRRSVLRMLEDELDRSERDGTALSVARLGLDHLKTINNTSGHPAGDRALQAFATAVQAHRRDTDVFGRLGGGEFLLILSATLNEDAVRTVEQLYRAVADTHRHATSPGLHFTFSVGVATWQDGETTEQLLNRADDALDGALHAGRDCSHAG